MTDPALTVQNLSVGFKVGNEIRPVLNDLTFDVQAGEIIGIVGESGSGKSTALFAAMNYLADNAEIKEGQVLLQGEDLLSLSRPELDAVRGSNIAMVFQDPTSALNPSMTIGGQIAEGVARHLGIAGQSLKDRVLFWLEKVRLENPNETFFKYPHELSGGQRQRAMIALALAMEPNVLLMDEPTTALDVIVQTHILELVRDLCRETKTGVVFVTHDLGAVAQIADRILVLYAGETMEFGAASQVLQTPCNPYTRGLIAALPKMSARMQPKAIPGSISNDPQRFDTCVFSDRCQSASNICKTTRPAIQTNELGVASRCHFKDPEGSIVQVEEVVSVKQNRTAKSTDIPILAFSAVDVTYRSKPSLSSIFIDRGQYGFVAVNDMSFDLSKDRTLAIVGESGSGKTTIARAVLRLVQPSAGQIFYEGQDLATMSQSELRAFRQKVQIVFQHPTSSLNARKSVLDLVSRPMILAGSNVAKAEKAALAMLNEVGLDESYSKRRPHELSGGEMQRVAIARAFVTEPSLLILDEPTTALDVSVQASVLQLLARLKQEHGCTFLLISHDLAVVRQLADDIIVMRHGYLCESGTVDQIYANPQHEYTRELMESAPSL